MLTVKVKPGSSKGPLVIQEADQYTVYLRAKAVDGAANKQLIEVLAKHFKVPKSKVTIVKGHTGRLKFVDIAH